MSKKVLFITPKWCDLNPNLSLTNDYHNIFKSFSEFAAQNYTYDVLHLDEAQVTYGSHIDYILPAYVQKYGADIIIFSLLGGSSCNPSLGVYQVLKDLGCYLCVFWPDSGPSWGMETIRSLNPIIDLHVSWDCPKAIEHPHWQAIYNDRADNHIDLWTPECADLYHNRDKKDIDLSFLGSTNKYADRTAFVNEMMMKYTHKNIYVGGGQRQGKLTPEEYASIVRRSKIGVNFSLSQTSVFHQLKGHVLEYTASEAMLLESANPITREFYKEGYEYREFISLDDLFSKIEYCFKHEESRQRMATAGYKRYNENYTGNHFWNKLMNRIENE